MNNTIDLLNDLGLPDSINISEEDVRLAVDNFDACYSDPNPMYSLCETVSDVRENLEKIGGSAATSDLLMSIRDNPAIYASFSNDLYSNAISNLSKFLHKSGIYSYYLSRVLIEFFSSTLYYFIVASALLFISANISIKLINIGMKFQPKSVILLNAYPIVILILDIIFAFIFLMFVLLISTILLPYIYYMAQALETLISIISIYIFLGDIDFFHPLEEAWNAAVANNPALPAELLNFAKDNDTAETIVKAAPKRSVMEIFFPNFAGILDKSPFKSVFISMKTSI